MKPSLFVGLATTLPVLIVGWSGSIWAQVRPPQEPSAVEQLLIYELNRARNNPARFDTENNLSVDLSGVAAQPPLAVNNNLVGFASFHAEEMATFNYFAHTSAVTGDQPNKMARDNGYPLPAFYPDAANNIESIAGGSSLTTALSVLTLLIVDAGVPSLGHRIHLLCMKFFFQTSGDPGQVSPKWNFQSYLKRCVA